VTTAIRPYFTDLILAFERDGWKCTKCGSQENLQAYHIEPVPKETFDPIIIHRVENLQTLCAECHLRVRSILNLRVMTGNHYLFANESELIMTNPSKARGITEITNILGKSVISKIRRRTVKTIGA
jgi:HNH endonuclease